MGDLLNIRRPALSFSMLPALGVLLALMAFSATRAEANTYCVDVPGPTGCLENQSNFQDALDHAAANPGPDTVQLGPITVQSPTGFSYLDTTSGNTVDIVGAGVGQTFVKLDAANTGTATMINLQGLTGSKVHDLSVDLSGNDEGQFDIGINLLNGSSASDVAVTGVGADNVRGIECSGCKISNAKVDLPHGTFGNFAVVGYAGDTELVDSNVSADYAVEQSDPNGTATIKRSKLAGNYGIYSDGGGFNVQDSTIRLWPGPNTTGVEMFNANGGTVSMNTTLDGVTIVGDGTSASTRGIDAEALHANVGGQSATVQMNNSVITGTTSALRLVSDENQPSSITTSHSAYDPSKIFEVEDDSGLGVDDSTFLTEDPSNVDISATGPGFVDQANGNFNLLPTSALVDKGDPAAPASGVTDILGHRRDCNSTPTGTFRRDIGAYEYNDCILPNTLIQNSPGATTTDRTPAFQVASSKVNSTFKCSFDGGTPAACNTSFDAPDLGLGDHTLSAVATDEYGNVDPTPATAAWKVVEPATCATDPSLCPVTDTTPPKVSFVGKVPAKTTRSSLKVKFTSNEAGSTFTCQVGKAKAKSCKSPFKLKLKKGRNVLKIVATDKAANKSKPLTVKVKRKK